MTRDVLAIVGSVRFTAAGWPAIVRRIVDDELAAHRPDAVVSGGAAGVDTAAEAAARRHGIEFIGHRPTVRRWAGPGGFMERNQRIADTCTRALRIHCADSTTYGSGWTVARAAERGVPVRHVQINSDGTVVDSGWPAQLGVTS